MKLSRILIILIVIGGFSLTFLVLEKNISKRGEIFSKDEEIGNISSQADEKTSDTGTMHLGNFVGKVVYDPEEDYYFLELRGVRLPFKTSPIIAQEVKLEAPGKTKLEKNTALLYGILGPEVKHATLLINPDEEEEVMHAVTDLARYIQIAGPRKFAGIAYTKEGGKIKKPPLKGSRIQSLDRDASKSTPLIQLKGPKSGAESTRVRVLGEGRFIIEGKTYEELWKAADFVCITLVKMLCGSPDCPDAAACATGGDCGCGA
jgi:hypothetical protein